MAADIETVRIPVAALVPARSLLAAKGGTDEELLSVLLLAEDAVAEQFIALLTTQLHRQAATLSNDQVSTVIRLIAHFDEQREAAKLAASPARQASIERAAKTFASRNWKGAFVGGKLLVEAVTQGAPSQPVLGNYPDSVLLPEKA